MRDPARRGSPSPGSELVQVLGRHGGGAELSVPQLGEGRAEPGQRQELETASRKPVGLGEPAIPWRWASRRRLHCSPLIFLGTPHSLGGCGRATRRIVAVGRAKITVGWQPAIANELEHERGPSRRMQPATPEIFVPTATSPYEPRQPRSRQGRQHPVIHSLSNTPLLRTHPRNDRKPVAQGSPAVSRLPMPRQRLRNAILHAGWQRLRRGTLVF